MRTIPTRRGFTLLEVMVALVVASIGVTYLYEGIALSLVAEERTRFYERCARFLDEELAEQILAAGTGGTRTGLVKGTGYEIMYELRATASQEVDGLTQIAVKFTGKGPHSPPVASVTTYFTPALRRTKLAESTKP